MANSFTKLLQAAASGLLLLSFSVPAAGSDEVERALAVLDELDGQMISVDYRDEPLEQVIADLNARLSRPVRADWAGLEGIDIDEDTPVTLRLPGARAAAVLSTLALVVGDEFARPTFEVHAGQIVLTSFEGTEPMRLTDVYDVRDLLKEGETIERLRESLPMPDAPPEDGDAAPVDEDNAEADEDSPQDDQPDAPEEAPPPGEEQKLGQMLQSKAPKLPELPEPRPRTSGERLILLITDHVDPEAWINYGGDAARINERDGAVMVTAPPTVHRKLRDALAQLRRVNPRGLTIEACIIDVLPSELARQKRRYGASSAMLGRSLLRAEETVLLWRAESAVAIDQSAEIESRAGEAIVRLEMKPTFEKSTGSLSLTVEAAMTRAGDERSVRTTVAMPHRNGGAVLELPPVAPGDSVRLLVLLPEQIG